MVGAKVWVDNQVDFSDNKNLMVAAITLKFDQCALSGIGTATFGAILLWALLGHKRRG